MKKAALLIALLSLVVATLAADHMRVLDSYAANLKTSLTGSTQKPKGDELTEAFNQTYPLSPTGRVSIANINGDVHINVWDQGSVKVDAVKRAYSQQRLSEVTIDLLDGSACACQSDRDCKDLARPFCNSAASIPAAACSAAEPRCGGVCTTNGE